MGFNAGKAVSRLDYDFTDYLPGVKGVIPEPSSEQVLEMQHALRELYHLNDPDPQAIVDIMKSMTQEDFKARDRELAAIYADACSQQPTTEEILKLPHRVQVAFIGYVSGEFQTPTGGSSGTRR